MDVLLVLVLDLLFHVIFQVMIDKRLFRKNLFLRLRRSGQPPRGGAFTVTCAIVFLSSAYFAYAPQVANGPAETPIMLGLLGAPVVWMAGLTWQQHGA